METTFEIEVKIACDGPDRIREAGFDLKLVKPRYFEDNWLLDSTDRLLFNKGAALRVRSVEGQGTITYKGIVRERARSPLKIREEIESDVSDPERMIQLLERLGYSRTSYRFFRDLGRG